MRIQEEASRCLLCHHAACTRACPHGGDPARAVRAIRFDNTAGAAAAVDSAVCRRCDGDCERACVHDDRPLRLQKMLETLPEHESVPPVDLSVEFLGVRCENPFFLSSSIVAGNYEMCANALSMGWAGVVFKTIGFLTPQEVSPRFDALRKEATPFVGFKNLEQISDHPLLENLETLRRLKEAFPDKVIVASIMGQNEEEWTQLARMVTEAGVDIIECNFSCPHMTGHGLGADVGQNEELVQRYTACVKAGTTLPVLAKMTPNLGNMELPAIAAMRGGADGLAAINTVKCITGLDLDHMQPAAAVGGQSAVSGYSGKAVKPIALRFIHDLAKCPSLKNVPLSGMGGIETWRDAAEFLALGCRNVQVTTAVMQYGYRIIDDLIGGLSAFMAQNGYRRVDDLIGAALGRFVSPDELDRHSVELPRFDRAKCVGCGRCYLSCRDAGHQALRMDEATGKPVFVGKQCVGCQLCRLVCPTGAIDCAKRVERPQTP